MSGPETNITRRLQSELSDQLFQRVMRRRVEDLERSVKSLVKRVVWVNICLAILALSMAYLAR